MTSVSTTASLQSVVQDDSAAPSEELLLRGECAALFAQHARYVCRVLRRMGVAERDLDDVCQDAFLTVHRKLAGFEARSSSKTWIYGICLRLAANYRRSARHRHEQPSSELTEQASAPDQDAAALNDIDRVLATLSDPKREVFVLYEFGELTMLEVAEVVGSPLKTCFSRLHAARRELRAALTRAEEP
ncbi:MAG TPA: RNA polymerase sigma factor [Polyangiales bacterium]|nr:RNA polymerase sigma factor [Polyangiales bacterium]